MVFVHETINGFFSGRTYILLTKGDVFEVFNKNYTKMKIFQSMCVNVRFVVLGLIMIAF